MKINNKKLINLIRKIKIKMINQGFNYPIVK